MSKFKPDKQCDPMVSCTLRMWKDGSWTQGAIAAEEDSDLRSSIAKDIQPALSPPIDESLHLSGADVDSMGITSTSDGGLDLSVAQNITEPRSRLEDPEDPIIPPPDVDGENEYPLIQTPPTKNLYDAPRAELLQYAIESKKINAKMERIINRYEWLQEQVWELIKKVDYCKGKAFADKLEIAARTKKDAHLERKMLSLMEWKY